ncbi:DUF3311 domain-containing protein [Brevibacillus sp. NRS-1366]|uniref:DUF3311 domain-containing protein n=1 Tax=Brevibacillus sp. NRS-1366 TaxID=3233899 RepID=UPI003D1CEA65
MKPYYWLAIIPFFEIFIGVPWANRIEPYVLGMPFIMFWIIWCAISTSIIIGVIYRLDPLNKGSETE